MLTISHYDHNYKLCGQLQLPRNSTLYTVFPQLFAHARECDAYCTVVRDGKRTLLSLDLSSERDWKRIHAWNARVSSVRVGEQLRLEV